MITTNEAAEKLNVTPQRVRAMISSGRLKATRYGRDWMINPKDLNAVENRRPGRPKGRGKK